MNLLSLFTSSDASNFRYFYDALKPLDKLYAFLRLNQVEIRADYRLLSTTALFYLFYDLRHIFEQLKYEVKDSYLLDELEFFISLLDKIIDGSDPKQTSLDRWQEELK